MADIRKSAGGKPVDIIAVEPLKFGRKRYEPGEPLSVPQETADELMAMGHARSKADAEALPAIEAPASTDAESNAAASPAGGSLI